MCHRNGTNEFTGKCLQSRVPVYQCFSVQIKALDIEFWTKRFDDLRRQHQRQMYPPRVKMTIRLKSPDAIFKLPVKFTGCSSDSNLDMEITFPLGIL